MHLLRHIWSTIIFILSVISLPVKAELTTEEINRLFLCYKNAIDDKKAEEKFNIALSSYPKSLYYKFWIDKKRLTNRTKEEQNIKPELLFDKEEPGYNAAMYSTFEQLPYYININVSLPLIKELHDKAVSNVYKQWDNQLFIMDQGIAPGQYSYHLDECKAKNKTQAFYELYKSKILIAKKDIHIKKFIAEFTEEGSNILINGIDRGLNVLYAKLAPIIENYYAQINILKTLNGKLEAIAELLRALEVAHFLPDGNQRTYSFLLLPKLLIENGVPPAILDEPALFDGYLTVQEMAQDIKKGVINFFNESEAGHRKFLAGEKCEKKSNHWLENSDYKPYYQTVIN